MTRLKEIREKKKMTQMQLAEASGVKQATISDIERGKIKSPSLDTANSISRALGVKLEKVFPPANVEPEQVAS